MAEETFWVACNVLMDLVDVTLDSEEVSLDALTVVAKLGAHFYSKV